MTDPQAVPLTSERVRADLDALVAAGNGQPGVWVVTWEIAAPWRFGARWLQVGWEDRRPDDGWLLNLPDPTAAVSDGFIAGVGLDGALVDSGQPAGEWRTLRVRTDLRDPLRRAEAGEVVLAIAWLALELERDAPATSRIECL